MSIPLAGLLVVTLLFPALIGWSGATLGARGGPSPLRTQGNRMLDGTSREGLDKGLPAER